MQSLKDDMADRYIYVSGQSPCSRAWAEGDSATGLLNIIWLPAIQSQSLYLDVKGGRKGLVELTVEAETGALTKLTVVLDLPELELESRAMSALPCLPICRRPVLDRAIWALGKEEASGIDPSVTDTYTSKLKVSHDRIRETATVHFSDAAVAWRIQCKDVVVGIAANGALVAVEAAWHG